jgi:hypothetical protein
VWVCAYEFVKKKWLCWQTYQNLFLNDMVWNLRFILGLFHVCLHTHQYLIESSHHVCFSKSYLACPTSIDLNNLFCKWTILRKMVCLCELLLLLFFMSIHDIFYWQGKLTFTCSLEPKTHPFDVHLTKNLYVDF